MLILIHLPTSLDGVQASPYSSVSLHFMERIQLHFHVTDIMNTIETKPSSPYKSNVAYTTLMMTGWTQLIFKVIGQGFGQMGDCERLLYFVEALFHFESQEFVADVNFSYLWNPPLSHFVLILLHGHGLALMKFIQWMEDVRYFCFLCCLLKAVSVY